MVLEWVALGLVALIVLWVILAYNKFIRLENRVDNAWAQIDVQLKRRADLIPNLVETVKGYKNFEKEVLENVTKARAGLMGAMQSGDRVGAMQAEGMLERALGRLFAVAEAYPDLKANQNFLSLQDELAHTENKVSFARSHYNESILGFNNAVEQFPGNLVAGTFAKKEKPMLAIPEPDRAVPKVQF